VIPHVVITATVCYSVFCAGAVHIVHVYSSETLPKLGGGVGSTIAIYRGRNSRSEAIGIKIE
jgi:hypothetical protein